MQALSGSSGGRATLIRWIAGGAIAGAVLLVLFPDAFPVAVVLKGALLGAGTGLLAVGLVLTYRTTRIINFSYGAMGGVAAGFGVALHLSWGWPWFLCIGVAVVIGAGVGALVERMIIRRFASAPRLVLTVATIGLAQLLGGIGLLIPSWFDLPPVVPGFETALSDFTRNTKQVLFDGNDFLLLAVVPIVLISLTWFLLRSTVGIAVRGMAENMTRARLLGIPVNQLSILLWAIAGMLAALTVSLKAPNSGIPFEAAGGATLLLPALAAAVIARFTSIPGAFMAGVGLGVMDQLVQWNFPDRREVTNLFLLGAIVVALLVQKRPTSRALAGDDSWSSAGVAARLPACFRALPEIRAARVAMGAIVLAFLAFVPLFGRVAQVNYVTQSMILALAAVSLVAVTGWGGVINLGQFALVGVGGITAANLIADRNTDLFVVLGASAVAGGVVALLIGLPALRVTGAYLGVTTLAFAVVMEQYVAKPALHRDLMPDRFERPELWGVIDLDDERWLYVFVLATLAVGALVVHNLRRARAGRVIIATRDNERMASAAGINPVEARLGAFVLSGVIAGVAGALHAVTQRSVGEGSYPASTSLLLFSMAVIGGANSIGGTIAGVALIQFLGYQFSDYKILITGVGLLIILMVLPGGLAQAFDRVRDRFAIAVGRRHGITLAEDLESHVGADDELTSRLETGHLGGNLNQRLLEVEGLEVAYGSFQVLFGVDVTVGSGEVVAVLLGTNGAGKSTFLNSLGGVLPAKAGQIVFDGVDITNLPAEQVARLGFSLMPGGRGIFPTLTVAENLRLAGWMQRDDEFEAEEALEDVLTMFPILRERTDQHAGDLSGGEQQQLSLAMAMVTRPKLLCIDELSLGLAPAVVNQLVAKVREINKSGTAVLVVEQSINVALEVAERAVFLEHGQVRFRGRADQLLDHPEVLRAVFLGGVPEHQQRVETGGRPPRGVALEVDGLVKRFGGVRAVNDVSFRIEPGRIVGLIGHNGAGKTTIFDLICGFLSTDGGRVSCGGDDLTERPPHLRVGENLGRSFQEARLFPSLTVAENIAVALETHLGNRDPLAAALRLPISSQSEAIASFRVDEVIALLRLERFRDRPCADLSTGTRRVVEVACLIALDPAVLLLDEPTAGLSAPEAETMGPLLRTVQAETGCSIVVIEHNMSLMSSLCDEMIALDLGAVIARGTPEQVLADPGVVESYLGSAHAQ